MFQFILIIMSISLSAVALFSTLNYLPGWQKGAPAAEAMVQTDFNSIEQAYDVATRATGGYPPLVLTGSDGGFAAGLLPYLRFTPPTPNGYRWSYGIHANDESAWAGLNYVCLSPIAGTAGASESFVHGLISAEANFSPSQFFVSNSCGVTQNWAVGSQNPVQLSITFYLAYTPGISR